MHGQVDLLNAHITRRLHSRRARPLWLGRPEDEEVHSYINELASSFGTYLYGRRMYETMVYWETAHTVSGQPRFALDWARQWQAAEKIVYSRTLAEPRQRADEDRALIRSRRSPAAQGQRRVRHHC